MHRAPSFDALDLEFDEAILDGRYELNEADFIRRSVGPGDIVIDLGAHVGAHTTLLAERVGPSGFVIAIEPCEAHWARLVAAISEAGVSDRVEALNAAAGDREGERDLLVSAHGQASRQAWLMPAGRETGPLDVVERVRVVRVDGLPRRGRVSFMKVDVEGAESLALAGASALLASDRPVLLVDLHPHLMPIVSGEQPVDLIARLNTVGYRCHLLGAGLPSTAIADTPSNAVTPVVFLPDDPHSSAPRDPGR